MKPAQKPNIHAIRYRRSFRTVLDRQLLKSFKKKYPEYKTITFADLKKIIQTFNGNIRQGVIEHRNGVELPEGLGFIFIGTCPPTKKRVIDFKKSAELGVCVTHKNWESDNHLMKIFYTNYSTKYPFQNKQVWLFKPVKQFRHTASVEYKNNYSKYIEISPYLKISTIFDKYRKRDYMQSLKAVIPEDYNEFKL
jgi:hypothetical protein